jgi:hypothetical protein
VYGRDWDYHPVTVPPSEAQFLEAMQMNATQLAAVYGLPPDRVGGKRGDSLTYSTVQQGALQIIEALRPWIVRLETAFFKLLPTNRLARFNSDALLKTDLAERANIYRTWREIGFQSVDEMRDTEDLEPLPRNTGKDNIPLEAIVAMARSTRAIPNELIPQVTLEQRLLYEYLQSLAVNTEPPGLPPGNEQPAGPGSANAPPPVSDPGAAGANVAGPGGTGGYQPINVMNQIVKDMLSVRDNGGPEGEAVEQFLGSMIKKHIQADRNDQSGPEFLGPWVPPDRARSNGNGRH